MASRLRGHFPTALFLALLLIPTLIGCGPAEQLWSYIDGGGAEEESSDASEAPTRTRTVTQALVCADADGDGQTSAVCGGTDCDDWDITVNPGAAEQCDGKDNDCDGEYDEGLASCDLCATCSNAPRVRAWGTTTFPSPTRHAIAGDIYVGGHPWADMPGSETSLNTGAVTIRQRDQGGAGKWGEVGTISIPSAHDFFHFGIDVAYDGQTLAVGTVEHDRSVSPEIPKAGSVYVYKRDSPTATTFTELKVLRPPTPTYGSYAFGSKVEVYDDILVVSAHGHDDFGNDNKGAVYIYQRDLGGTDNWGLVTVLTPPDRASEDIFGAKIALTRDRLVVTSRNLTSEVNGFWIFDRHHGGTDNWGVVVSRRAPSRAKVGEGVGTMGPCSTTAPYAGSCSLDSLSTGVDIDGDTVAIVHTFASAADQVDGDVYIFQKDAGGVDNWGEVRRIQAVSTPSTYNGARYWGYALSLDAGRLVIGDMLDSSVLEDLGAAFVYEQDAGGANHWGLTNVLYPHDQNNVVQWAQGVYLDGNYLLSISLFYDIFHNWAVNDVLGLNACPGTLNCAACTGDVDGDGWDECVDCDDNDPLRNPATVEACNLVDDNCNGYVDDGITCSPCMACAAGTPEIKLATAVGAMAAQGDLLVTGDFYDDTMGTDAGAVNIYGRDVGGAGAWGLVTKITAADGVAGDWFGRSVALDGDWLAVGAPRRDKKSSGKAASDVGGVYLFHRNQGGADAWGQVRVIAEASEEANAWFGMQLALSGDVLAVGTDRSDTYATDGGKVNIYLRDFGGANAWGYLKEFTGPTTVDLDAFGRRLAVDGEYLVAGGTTKLHVFGRHQGATDNFGLVATLVPSYGASFSSVDIEGTTIAVGDTSYGSDGQSSNGGIVVFEKDQGGADAWGEVAILVASDRATGDWLGADVALEAGAVVASATADDDMGDGSGSVYVFKRDEGGPGAWGEVGKLVASDGLAGDGLGQYVAASGDTVYTTSRSGVGAVYIYGSTTCPGTTPCDGGCLDADLDGHTDQSCGGTDCDDTRSSVNPGLAEVCDDGLDNDCNGVVDDGCAVTCADADADGYSTCDGDCDDTRQAVNPGAAEICNLIDDNCDGVVDEGCSGCFDVDGDGYDGYDAAQCPDGVDCADADALVHPGAEEACNLADDDCDGQVDEGLSCSSCLSCTGPVPALKKVPPAYSAAMGRAIAIDGDVLAVGAPLQNNNTEYEGAVFVYGRDVGGVGAWGFIKELSQPTPYKWDRFGDDLSISGDWLAVGAVTRRNNGVNAGGVYLFNRNQGGADNWGMVTEIFDVAAEDGAYFGGAVAIDGDVLAVGASGDDQYGVDAGKVDIYLRDQGGANAWGHRKSFAAPTTAAGSRFGYDVAVSGDYVLVGASGDENAHLFGRHVGGTDNFGYLTTLAASAPQSASKFGRAVAIDGTTAVVGAFEYAVDGVESGATFVYEEDRGGVGAWGEAAILISEDRSYGDRFGWSVAIEADAILSGARYQSRSGLGQAGAAYLFSRDQGGAQAWGQLTKFTASDAAAADQLGWAVDLTASTVALGAPLVDDSGADTGAAYIFGSSSCPATAGCDGACPDIDLDGYRDGSCGGADCDDTRAGNHPTAPEVCGDFMDNDCDGYADEACGAGCGDADGDGYTGYDAATCPDGDDCDDASASNHPGAAEVCGDGVDNDCDGVADDGCTPTCVDVDGDGYDGYDAADCPSGSDCIDSAATVFPGAAEFCNGVDDDCDGTVDESCTPICVDADGDGYDAHDPVSCPTGLDCDDSRSATNPGAVELCNLVDDNCDGVVDEGCTGCVDADADGVHAYDEIQCPTGGDCDDTDPQVFPGMSEGCNLVDDNCDGQVDEGIVCDACISCGGTVPETSWLGPGGTSGYARALDADGALLAVGAPLDAQMGSNAGAVFLYGRDVGGAEAWGLIRKITAPDAVSGDAFGSSVALSGDWLAVGAPKRDKQGAGKAANDSGGVYIFHRNQGGADAWGFVRSFVDTTEEDLASFGEVLVMEGDVLVVGTPHSDDNGTDSGKVNVYLRDAGGANTWGLLKSIRGSDSAAGDYLGGFLDIDGNLLVVGHKYGVTGSAFVFDRNQGGADSFGQVARLSTTDPGAVSFGQSVAVAGTTVAVGDTGYTFGGFDEAGAVFVFDRDQGGANAWGEVTVVLSPEPVMYGRFGADVAMSPGTLIIEDNGRFHVRGQDEGGASAWGAVGVLTPSTASTFEAMDILGNRVFGGFRSPAPGSLVIFGSATCNAGSCSASCPDIDMDGFSDASCGGTDCDDSRATVYSGAVEACGDFVDNNCDGVVDEGCGAGCVDGDLDGFTGYDASLCPSGTDCDDGNPAVHPGAAEVCDGFDNDCDGLADNAPDADGDGYDTLCDADCDDGNAAVHPGAAETCNNLDDDCDGTIDSFDRACYSGPAGTADIGQCASGTETCTAGTWGSCTGEVFPRCTSTADVKLVPTGEPSAAHFGYRVASQNGTLVTGADISDRSGTSNGGGVYVYYQSADGSNAWTQQALLYASDLSASQQLGAAVALEGDTLVAGAKEDVPTTDAGSAYVFYRDEGGADSWGEVKKIAPAGLSTDDLFGAAVSLSGDVLAVSARGDDTAATDAGAVYVFYRNQGGADAWGQVAKLVAPDAASGDVFGWHVVVSGDTIVVGSEFGDGAAVDSGSLYIYERHQGGTDNWGFVTEILPDGAAATNDAFGFAFDLDDEHLVVGAPGHSELGVEAGAVYIYDRSTWGFLTKINSPTTAAYDHYGASIALDGDSLVVGSSWGAKVSLHERDAGGAGAWGETELFAAVSDGFGISVDLEGGLVFSGAMNDDDVATDAGAVFVFEAVGLCQPELCDGIDNDCNGTVDDGVDADGDGADTVCGLDCDDSDATAFPGGTEVCDAVDNDCDGMVDEGSDADGDTYEGVCGSDCDDAAAAINPGAAESCNLVDDNCDGVVDEGLDLDGDGYTSCGGDCAEGDATIHPGAAELCDGVDNDCDTQIDEGCNAGCVDGDGDGYNGYDASVCVSGLDCDDGSAAIKPGAAEACDGIDNDCNGWIDDGTDADGDGDDTVCGGDCNDSNPNVYVGAPESCNGIDDDCNGLVDDGSDADADGFDTVCDDDCDDTEAARFPGNPEICDTKDNDCNGLVDDGADADLDGADTVCGNDCDDADPANFPGNTESCDLQDNDCDAAIDEGFDLDADGYTSCGGDCADGDATRNPGVAETCDGIDNNCDGTVDEGCNAGCVDADGDTFMGYDAATCISGADCDDLDPAIKPGAAEACNLVDDDCDGQIDEAPDADADGYDTLCDNDCDDTRAGVYPGATEVCNGRDDDCDGSVDESPDADGDGITVCGGDCDDADATVYPGAAELCDLQDNDCDGQIDEAPDADADGFDTLCDADCDDTRAGVYPGATEVCNGRDDDCDGTVDESPDADGDGITVCGGDCDDSDPTVHPGAAESCNLIDDNCNGQIDEAPDADGDGFDALCGGDCADGDPSINPGAAESCNSVDDDCDGQIDEAPDADGDGYDTLCDADCDDALATVHPGAVETCNSVDDDCDGQIDEAPDADGDGYDTLCDADCDDADPASHPGAAELCDGADNDCDSVVDEGVDLDADGYDDVCDLDCDDTKASVHPGAAESCNTIDDDCDGQVDEAPDADADGHDSLCDLDCDDSRADVFLGAPELCDGVDNDCDGQVDESPDADGDGVTVCGGDCDDADATVKPGAAEICDGKDNDCNGFVDDGSDADADGYDTVCDADCDDLLASVNPGAAEACNGADDNCDGQIDEAPDADLDGFDTLCDADCDDTSGSVHPGAAEVCNGVDDDCSGSVDDGGADASCDDGVTCTTDACAAGSCQNTAANLDGDPADCLSDCDDMDLTVYPGAPEACDGIDNDCDATIDEGFDGDGDGWTSCGGDCDDAEPTINPGATDTCYDAIDNDCDGQVDEGCPTCVDADGDGFDAYDALACPTGTDCDDANAAVNPGRAETCNGVDDDCDAQVDEAPDADGDGFDTLCGGDCDDTDPAIRPGAAESCNLIDDNCNGQIDEAPDADGDGYDTLCDADCNDANAAVHPGAVESCNAVDDNCNGQIDEGSDADGDGVDTVCGADCDDADALVHPGAAELCDAKDNDCNGQIDDGSDADADGYDTVCGGDCNDALATVNPGAAESCNAVDDDCDGQIDEAPDADGDGYDTLCGGDCDDAVAAVNPGAAESCNLVDDDCDGQIDEAPDADGDGYDTLCDADCDDAVASVHPGAAESCNGVDDDCDGSVDEDFDIDADGYTSCGGDCDDLVVAVNPAAAEVCNGVDDNCTGGVDEGFDLDGDGYTTCQNDCDDSQAGINPGAAESCGDNLDNNCDGDINESCCGANDCSATCGAGEVCGKSCSDWDPVSQSCFTSTCGYSGEACAECSTECYRLATCNGAVDPTCAASCETRDPATNMCAPKNCGNNNHDYCAGCIDLDADGFDAFHADYCPLGTDCYDADAGINPSATEICNGFDDNCDGVIDEGCGLCFDDDADGYFGFDAVNCSSGRDCNDASAAANPAGAEVCDGLDNDCDGLVDEGFDLDGDGYTSCQNDCDDTNALINPGRAESCNGIDDNCTGGIDEGFDTDGDGYTTCQNDCDDTSALINPLIAEACNGIDDNCDGSVDEGFDLDADGYRSCDGDCADTNAAVNPGVTEVCNGIDDNCTGGIDEGFDTDGDGYTTCQNDCDDTSALINPLATEVCNGIDDDCDGAVDEGSDLDGDGVTVCAGDCDDADPSVFAGAAELCDGLDNDCDSLVDEGFDLDGDGYRTCDNDCDDASAAINPGVAEACNGIDDDCDLSIDEGFDADADGYTSCGGDCDDSAAAINPLASELCDGLDNDCDGFVDEGFDLDADGYTVCGGDCDDAAPSVNPDGVEICDLADNDCDGFVDEGFDLDGDGYTTCEGDCDDARNAVYPGAAEGCDGLDNDCNGVVDEGFDLDADGYTSCGGDCDDGSAAINPMAAELCDAVDNDCDGSVDEGFDADLDGYTSCGGDCNDSLASVNPGVLEACNGVDDDCDGAIDEGFDVDADGQTTCDGDCADADPTIYTGATELCDSKDNDCDSVVDEGCPSCDDLDGDGYNAFDATLCTTGTDCDDGNAAVHPGAAEICNNVDDDCDGAVDETPDANASCADANACTTDVCDGAGSCSNPAICAGTDTSCGCSTCTDCDAQDGWYDVGVPYACCDPNNGDACASCQDQEQRDYACGGTSCTYTIVGTQTLYGACAACDDANLCTDDVCAAGSCTYTNNAATQSCYTGPAGTEGVGACVAGTQTCSGGALGACEGEVTPTAETCDGVDDDCDGAVDESPDVDPDCDDGNACTTDACVVGACSNTSTCAGDDTSCGCASCTDCDASDGWYDVGAPYACCDGLGSACTCQDQEFRDYGCGGTSCSYTVTTTNVQHTGCASCDDGNVCTDDSCSLGACVNTANSVSFACYTGPLGSEGVGACVGGTATCSGGSLGGCVGEVTPQPESCDAIDEDCNGVIDDGTASGSCGAGQACHWGTCFDDCSGLDCSTATSGGICYTDDFRCDVPDDPCAQITCPTGMTCYGGSCYDYCADHDACDPSDELCYQSGRCADASDPCLDVQCPSDQICYGGGCYQACTGDADCTLDPSHVCYDGRCASDACQDVDCPVGTACHGGACYETCTTTADCTDPTSVCYDGYCKSSACEGVECPLGPPAQQCYQGVCYETCSTTVDCSDPTHECYDGYCTDDPCAGALCPDGQACYQGSCFQSCTGDDDCTLDPAHVCYDGRCADTLCMGVVCPDGDACYEGICYESCSESIACSDPTHQCWDNRCVDPCDGVSCLSDEACYGGSCYEQCSADADCSNPDHVCYDARCVDSLDPYCDGVSCPGGEACYRGACYASCLDQTSCDPNEICYDDTCVPTDCSETICEGGEICYEGVCYQACTGDEDCTLDPSHACYDGRCANSACEAMDDASIQGYNDGHLFHALDARLYAFQTSTPWSWPRPTQDLTPSAAASLNQAGVARVVVDYDSSARAYQLVLMHGAGAAASAEVTYSVLSRGAALTVLYADDDGAEASFASSVAGEWNHLQVHVTTAAGEVGGVVLGTLDPKATDWEIQLRANFGGSLTRWELFDGESMAPMVELNPAEPWTLTNVPFADTEIIAREFGHPCDRPEDEGICRRGTHLECENHKLRCYQTIFPAAVELCDGVDNTCNGLVDAADAALGVPMAFSRQHVGYNWTPWPSTDEARPVGGWLNYSPRGSDDRIGSTDVRGPLGLPIQKVGQTLMAMHRNLGDGQLSMPILQGAPSLDPYRAGQYGNHVRKMRVRAPHAPINQTAWVAWYDDRKPVGGDELPGLYDTTRNLLELHWIVEASTMRMESDAAVMRPIWLEPYNGRPTEFWVEYVNQSVTLDESLSTGGDGYAWRRYTARTPAIELRKAAPVMVKVAAEAPMDSLCIADTATPGGCWLGNYMCGADGRLSCSAAADANCLSDCEDLDGDGHLAYNPISCNTGTDCDDANPVTYAGAVEICDGYDNDCDGHVDVRVETDPETGQVISLPGGDPILQGPPECGGDLSCVCPDGPERPEDPVDTCYCDLGLTR